MFFSKNKQTQKFNNDNRLLGIYQMLCHGDVTPQMLTNLSPTELDELIEMHTSKYEIHFPFTHQEKLKLEWLLDGIIQVEDYFSLTEKEVDMLEADFKDLEEMM